MRVYEQGNLNEAFGYLEPLASMNEPENQIAITTTLRELECLEGNNQSLRFLLYIFGFTRLLVINFVTFS